MGRLAEGKTITYGVGPLKQVRHWHKAMARIAVAKGGRPSELAALFGITAGQVSRILASPLFQAEMGRLESQAEYNALDMRTELQMRQGLSLENLDKCLLSADKSFDHLKLAKDVSLEILDRTGYGKAPHGALVDQSKTVVIQNFAPMPGEDPGEVKKRLGEQREIAASFIRGDEEGEEEADEPPELPDPDLYKKED